MKKLLFSLILIALPGIAMDSNKLDNQECLQQIINNEPVTISPQESIPAEIENSKPSISIIYYPTGTKNYGHMKLEIDGSTCFLGSGQNDLNATKKPLSSLIEHAKHGAPFVRFIFSANSERSKKLLQSLVKKSKSIDPSLTCSQFALEILADQKITYVPFPLNKSPLVCAGCLKLGYTLALNNIEQIEYHGSNFKKSYHKIFPGIINEGAPIILIVGAIIIICQNPSSIIDYENWPLIQIIQWIYNQFIENQMDLK